jgi:hypothetical protein
VNLLPTRRDLPYFAVVVAVLSTVLLYPLNDDNAHYQSMALELLRFGKWPYIGTWDQNFPGVILFHIIPISLFGPSDFGFRLFDLILQIIFVLILYRLWRRWLTEHEAWFAVMIYAFCYVRSAPFIAGQRDQFAAMILLAVAVPFLRDQIPSLTTVFLLGLAAGIAVLIRPTFEAYILLIAALTPLRTHKGAAVLFVAAGLVPLAVSFGIYALWPTALHQYWLATVRFNLDTYAQIARPFSSFFKGLVSPKLLSIPAFVGIYLLVWKKRVLSVDRNSLYLYYSAIALTILLVLMQRKYYLYHYAIYLILLTPLAGIGIKRILRPIPARLQMPLFVFMFFLCSLPYEALLRDRSLASRSPVLWVQRSYGDVYWHDIAERSIISYIRNRTADTDRIEVCSFDPRLRVHLGRQPVGKYASLHAMGYLQDRSDPNSLTTYQQEWMREYVDTLAAVRPKYIVVLRTTVAEYLTDPFATVLSRSPAFMSLLTSSYRLDTTIGGDDIYARKDQP